MHCHSFLMGDKIRKLLLEKLSNADTGQYNSLTCMDIDIVYLDPRFAFLAGFFAAFLAAGFADLGLVGRPLFFTPPTKNMKRVIVFLRSYRLSTFHLP